MNQAIIHEQVAARQAIWAAGGELFDSGTDAQDLPIATLAALIVAVEMQAEALGLNHRIRFEGGEDE